MIKILDNFLDKTSFKEIKELIFNNNFPWFYQDQKVDKKDNEYQFTHVIYDNHCPNSDVYYKITSLIDKLNIKSLIRVKLNLTTKEKTIRKYNYHKDFNFDCTTAIFYLNTNNGKTLFKNKEQVDSIENRMIRFPSTLEHAGTTHTNEKTRAVMNINYF